MSCSQSSSTEGSLSTALQQFVNNPPPDDELTVGDPLIELVPVGDDDHEDHGEGDLDEEEAEDAYHSEGGHHGVRLLQIVDVDLALV